jgi:Putative auto-transporter adhesin, head GIN domain
MTHLGHSFLLAARLSLLPASLLFASGCDGFAIRGSGKIVTVEPELRGQASLKRLSVCCGFHVAVQLGEQADLQIRGDDNLLEEIMVRTEGDELSVGFPESLGGYRPTQPIEVEVTLTDLTHLSASGGSEIRLNGELAVERLAIEMSGGGYLTTEALRGRSLELDLSGGSLVDLGGLDLDSLGVDASGGAELTLGGEVGTLEASLSGGGKLRAFECEADAVSLSMSGGGNAEVNARDVLDVSASGGSYVFYRGEPETIAIDLSGGSSVEPQARR